jgi:ubiquinone/menaquinone biosynthesis C-methylase UbiE
MERKEMIQNAYRFTGKNSFYDGMITCDTLIGKLVCRLVWNMNKEECTEYQLQAISAIPEGFSGRLLEVPVGTGVITMPFYQTLADADIVCLDYSPDMMALAEKRAKNMGMENVAFQQGDVGKLPFESDSFDIVLSMNGFHVFPDKEAAHQECLRVLKPGGIFCGCMYVSGRQRRTDWIIRNVYQRLKFMSPPQETMGSLKKRLKNTYAEVEITNIKAVACFACRKK